VRLVLLTYFTGSPLCVLLTHELQPTLLLLPAVPPPLLLKPPGSLQLSGCCSLYHTSLARHSAWCARTNCCQRCCRRCCCQLCRHPSYCCCCSNYLVAGRGEAGLGAVLHWLTILRVTDCLDSNVAEYVRTAELDLHSEKTQNIQQHLEHTIGRRPCCACCPHCLDPMSQHMCGLLNWTRTEQNTQHGKDRY
jgi:hypothetical protein